MISPLDQVTIFEDATPPQLFLELTRIFPPEHFEALLAERFRFYKTTFWYPLEEQPKNVFESVISHLEPLAEPSSQVIGVEWWFSVVRTNRSPLWILPCHFDRADLAENNFDKIRYPEKASVLFLNSVPYGELVVTDQVLTKKGLAPKMSKEARFIQPRENRYALFPGQLYHGVIGRMWRPLEDATVRITMAVNWWCEKPKAPYLRQSGDCAAAFRLPI